MKMEVRAAQAANRNVRAAAFPGKLKGPPVGVLLVGAFLLVTLALSVGMGAVFTLVGMCEHPYCLWETGDE